MGLFNRKKKVQTPPKGNPMILKVKADVAGKHFRASSNDDTIGISWIELSRIMLLIPDLVERMRALSKQVEKNQNNTSV